MNEFLLPLQGATTHHIKTQGVALGYKQVLAVQAALWAERPFQGALAEYELYNRGLLLVVLGPVACCSWACSLLFLGL
jgi:hypothetical protein